MDWVDLLATYLFALKCVAIVTLLLMLVSGLDDFFIDLVYWSRRAWRHVTIYGHRSPLGYRALYGPIEQPLAIMVPAWRETGVIRQMAELAASTLDYENYHIFVGTYPNDPDTQHDVDEVCARFRNVHKVVCARPGPTSKADCLNNVLDAIFQFEKRTGVAFAGFILHDAEDVLSPLELRRFNYLVVRKDLIQVPVYPFERQWRCFTSLHYVDEFAEVHDKDVVVREALAGQVPSAGVGTCFSRRAVMALLADGDGIAFDVQSLTEDYDIGFRLKRHGMREIFVHFPVVRHDRQARAARPRVGQSWRASRVICVREYFPDTLQTAIRQKSRWIIGIVYQGYKTHHWTGDWTLNYFLWRDRKGAISNFVSFAATLILLQMLALAAITHVWAGAPRFPSIFEGGLWLRCVLWVNLMLMLNRMLQRAVFVTSYYGLGQGLMSIPRLFWGNLINFLANWRAIRQILACGDPRRVAWDKTSHDFPTVSVENRARRSLGRILVDQRVITTTQLERVLVDGRKGLGLASCLVHEGLATSEQIARALADQGAVGCERVDPFAVPEWVVREVPASIALRYAVLPLRLDGRTLVLASESNLDPVAQSALARKLARPVRYVIAHKGEVTVGVRYWYARMRLPDPRRFLQHAIGRGWLAPDRAPQAWERFVSRQVMLAEILISLGHLDADAFDALLAGYERSTRPLGEFLVDGGVISRATLTASLAVQASLQTPAAFAAQPVAIPRMAAVQ